MEQQNQDFESFEEMVQRAINKKAKADLKSNIMIRDLDIYCPKDHRPSNNTSAKVLTQETIAKDPCPKELKAKKTKPPYVNVAKLLEQNKKDRKDNKKRFRK